MILEQYDNTKSAVFDPNDVIERIGGFPKIGVSCFSKRLIDSFVSSYEHEIIAYLSGANGKTPVYKINYNGADIALYMSRVGAPACVCDYEEILAMGLEKLVMFGTCGVLDKRIDDLGIIIPTAAVRDEGTSYHYMPTSDEIAVNDKYKSIFTAILQEHGYTYTEGKVWTTDAVYRETHGKMASRKNMGCVCVDMECAAMSAAAKFREKDFFQFFYAADNLDGEWDMRSLQCDNRLSEKERIFLLALELAAKIADNADIPIAKTPAHRARIQH